MSATANAACLMSDFRTGYITMSAPKAMFATQIVGSIISCFVAPLAFLVSGALPL